MKKRLLAGIAGAAVAIAAFSILIAPALGSPFLRIVYYDSEGRPINPPLFSIVNDVEGVSEISLVATVQNTGEIPLDISIQSATPSAVANAFSGKTASLQPGQTQTITSERIPVSQWEGQTVTPVVTAKGSYIYAGESESILKSGSVTLVVERDKIASFGLSLGSSLGSSGSCVNSGTVCSGSDTKTCCSPSTCSVQVPVCKPNTCSGAQTSIDSSGCPVYTRGYYYNAWSGYTNICLPSCNPRIYEGSTAIQISACPDQMAHLDVSCTGFSPIAAHVDETCGGSNTAGDVQCS